MVQIISNGARIVRGGFRGNHVIYRTKDNTQDYHFDIDQQRDGTFRVYIEDQPPYSGKATDGHSTHRYYDDSRRQHYICIEENLKPETFQHALNWAKEWAESIERYRKCGQEF